LGAFIVYDISKPNTFNNIERWYKELKDHADQRYLNVVLVGNKKDLEHLRAIPYRVAKDYADKNNMLFFETSALDSSNVEIAFNTIVDEIYSNQKKKLENDVINTFESKSTIVIESHPQIEINKNKKECKC